MGGSLTSHITTDKSITDLMTKVSHSQKNNNLVSKVLYDIYDLSAIVFDEISSHSHGISHKG